MSPRTNTLRKSRQTKVDAHLAVADDLERRAGDAMTARLKKNLLKCIS
jgi:hypothetical protein